MIPDRRPIEIIEAELARLRGLASAPMHAMAAKRITYLERQLARRARAREQLAQAKKPIGSLESWESEEHLRDIAEGRA